MSPAPDPAAAGCPAPRHACPERAAEDALLLIASGRVDMGRVVLERLPGLVREALADEAELCVRGELP